MDTDTLCFGCGQALDLAVPHLTLLRQSEREDDGVVTVLEVFPAEYRHEDCPEAAR